MGRAGIGLSPFTNVLKKFAFRIEEHIWTASKSYQRVGLMQCMLGKSWARPEVVQKSREAIAVKEVKVE